MVFACFGKIYDGYHLILYCALLKTILSLLFLALLLLYNIENGLPSVSLLLSMVTIPWLALTARNPSQKLLGGFCAPSYLSLLKGIVQQPKEAWLSGYYTKIRECSWITTPAWPKEIFVCFFDKKCHWVSGGREGGQVVNYTALHCTTLHNTVLAYMSYFSFKIFFFPI